MLGLSALSSLAGFYASGVLAQQAWFYRAFGFDAGQPRAGVAPVRTAGGMVTFWFALLARWSRRHEYQADAFAAASWASRDSLIGALRKLNEKNLSNLTPHPLYSGFYYSHPTLLERERALLKVATQPAFSLASSPTDTGNP